MLSHNGLQITRWVFVYVASFCLLVTCLWEYEYVWLTGFLLGLNTGVSLFCVGFSLCHHDWR